MNDSVKENKNVKRVKTFLKSDTLLLLIAITILAMCVISLGNFYYKNHKNTKTYYKVKINDTWTNWNKNGNPIKNKNNYSITGLDFKVDSKYKGEIIYYCYYNNKWSSQKDKQNKCISKKMPITGIKIKLSGEISKDNDIFYRVYNNDYGWTEWRNNLKSVGSTDKAISNIEVRIVPKKSYYPDLLKDYDKKGKKSLDF